MMIGKWFTGPERYKSYWVTALILLVAIGMPLSSFYNIYRAEEKAVKTVSNIDVDNLPSDFKGLVIRASASSFDQKQAMSQMDGKTMNINSRFAHVDEVTSLLPDNTIIVFSLIFRRSTNSKIFSVAIILIMWALSITALTLSVTLWFRDRKVEPPTIGFIGSLLFALPQLRNNLVI
ncbi:hypothetical protein HDV02_005792 [Globomyces sp. JEL0801]|nr:hypothetical protein HDV02_005792 [Globomyces sp. JEL0801]